jgi:hypothetical protein
MRQAALNDARLRPRGPGIRRGFPRAWEAALRRRLAAWSRNYQLNATVLPGLTRWSACALSAPDILPAGFLAAFGRAADLVQRRPRTRLPWSAESIRIVNCDARCDDSKTRDEPQVEPCPLRETFADTVRWLAESGHLTPRQASGLLRSGPVGE